jgi:hypothetical protein
MKMKVLASREFGNETTDRTIEIDGFNRYSFLIEGNQITSNDAMPRKLCISISLDHTLNISLEKMKFTEEDRRNVLATKLGKGYEFYLETEADKVIKGVRGCYYYFKHKDTKDFVAIAIGSSKREYKIHLGKLDDPNSKLGTVLRSLPDQPFAKTQLVHILPYNIVENRQPIKAAIDILEKEGFVREFKKKGITQLYVKMDKKIPFVKESLVE